MERITRQEAEAAGHKKRGLAKVIRAKCIECSGGSQAEVRRCELTDCPLWPYRLGRNPFSTRKGNPNAGFARRFTPADTMADFDERGE